MGKDLYASMGGFCIACITLILFLLIFILAVSGCNNTKVETQAGGGSSTVRTINGQNCFALPDGTQSCTPTQTADVNATGGTGTVKTDTSTSMK